MSKFQLKHKVKIEWSPNFAYAIGLITSDGCLSGDQRHIHFTSKDLDMIENFKIALNINNKITKHARGGETEKRYLSLSFGDKAFYQYLNEIGLTSKKSKTIQAVGVPDTYFPDFLRGLFDGDGSFYVYWDKRWPNSFGYKISFASASPIFINWLKEKLASLYGVKGYLHKGTGVINLEYVKGDSRKIIETMYYKPKMLYLARKYNKIRTALDMDQKYGSISLQKQRKAGVA